MKGITTTLECCNRCMYNMPLVKLIYSDTGAIEKDPLGVGYYVIQVVFQSQAALVESIMLSAIIVGSSEQSKRRSITMYELMLYCKHSSSGL